MELIDLRTILPWDVDTIVESVRKTRRLVVVHEAGYTGGVGGEIAAEVQKRAFLRLEAPVKRVTGWEWVFFLPLAVDFLKVYDDSVPAALQFEKFNMPDAIRILDGIIETLTY